MIDNRFPWLVRPSDAPIDNAQRKALVSLCDQISKRTGRHLAYNCRSRSLYIWLKSIDQGLGFPFPLFNKDNTANLPDEDDVVNTIWLGQVPLHVKDKWLEQKQKQIADHEKEISDRRRDDQIHEAKDHLKRSAARSGMSSHYRPSVLVNGTKGA